MKIYATTKGKATKGQGSNTDLITVFTVEIDGERQEIGHIDILARPDHYVIDYALPDGTKGAINLANTTKGKRQKGEVCSIVGCHNFRNKDGNERYLDGQIVCDKHASQIDGY